MSEGLYIPRDGLTSCRAIFRYKGHGPELHAAVYERIFSTQHRKQGTIKCGKLPGVRLPQNQVFRGTQPARDSWSMCRFPDRSEGCDVMCGRETGSRVMEHRAGRKENVVKLMHLLLSLSNDPNITRS